MTTGLRIQTFTSFLTWIGRTLTLISRPCRGDVGTELSIPLCLRPTISPKIWPIQGKMPSSLARSIMPLVAVLWCSSHVNEERNPERGLSVDKMHFTFSDTIAGYVTSVDEGKKT